MLLDCEDACSVEEASKFSIIVDFSQSTSEDADTPPGSDTPRAKRAGADTPPGSDEPKAKRQKLDCSASAAPQSW